MITLSKFTHLVTSRAQILTQVHLASLSSQCFINIQNSDLCLVLQLAYQVLVPNPVSPTEHHLPPGPKLSNIPYSPLTSAEFSEPKLQFQKVSSFIKEKKVSISSEKPEWLFSLFVCLGSCSSPRKTFKILESSWLSVLKKNWHDNWTELDPEQATAYKTKRHFNHPVKVRKIHYQVVEGKQLAEISSRAERFQSVVLHSLYAWVVPGTTEDCAVLQCQGQERQLSLSGWLPLTAIWMFQASLPLPRWVSHLGSEVVAKDYFLKQISLLSCGPSAAFIVFRPSTHSALFERGKHGISILTHSTFL